MNGELYPTFTHVPPNRFDSTIMALVPNLPLAMRAAPRPPLPPPMTRRSVSLEMGAMMREEEENCLERDANRQAVVLETGILVTLVTVTVAGVDADADAAESLPRNANACIYLYDALRKLSGGG